MYDYKAEVVRVIDGDSVVLRVDVGFHVTFTDNFRLLGIEAAEVRTRDLEEKKAGLNSKAALERLLALGPLRIETEKSGKYGRWLATLYIQAEDGEFNANERMVDEGFAKPYR